MGQRFLHETLGLIVAILTHQPVAGEVEQMLVLGIHFQHVVHGGNAADEVAFLHFHDPSDHQLFSPGVTLGARALAFSRAAPDFLGIAAIEGDPCPGHGEIGICLYGGAPVVVAALQIKILVILHALLVKRASLRRRGGDGHGRRRRLASRDGHKVARQSRRQDNNTIYQDSVDGATHRGLRNRRFGGKRIDLQRSIAGIR